MDSSGRRPDQAKKRSFFVKGRADLRAATQPDPPAGRGSPKEKTTNLKEGEKRQIFSPYSQANVDLLEDFLKEHK